MPRSTNANAHDVFMEVVQHSMKQDGWDDFVKDMQNRYIYNGGSGEYYSHSQGDDFCQRVEMLQSVSAQHSSICQGKQLYVAGNGLNLGEHPSAQLKAFFENNPEASAEQAKAAIAEALGQSYTGSLRIAQMRGQNLTKLSKLIAKDLVDFGGSYLLVHVAGGKIVKQMHVPYRTVFVARPKDGDGGLTHYYLSSDGKVNDTTKRIHQFYPESMDPIQLVDLRMPHCMDSLYSYPDYLSAAKWILLDGYIADFHGSMAKRNYFLGGYIRTSANPPKAIRDKAKQELNKGFSGTDQAGQWMILWGSDKDTTISSWPIHSTDKLFQQQQEFIKFNVRSAHKVVDPALLGLPSSVNSGVVFQNPDSLRIAMRIFQSTVIAPIQFVISDWLNEALRYNGIDETVTINEFVPVQSNEWANYTTMQINNDAERIDDAPELNADEKDPDQE